MLFAKGMCGRGNQLEHVIHVTVDPLLDARDLQQTSSRLHLLFAQLQLYNSSCSITTCCAQANRQEPVLWLLFGNHEGV